MTVRDGGVDRICCGGSDIKNLGKRVDALRSQVRSPIRILLTTRRSGEFIIIEQHVSLLAAKGKIDVSCNRSSPLHSGGVPSSGGNSRISP